MGIYICFAQIEDWSLGLPEVEAVIAEVLGDDWKSHYVPAFAGRDGIWFDPK